MASRFQQIVTNSTDASGSAEFVVEDSKKFTGRLVFIATGGSPAATYAVKIRAFEGEASSNCYVKHSGTVSGNTDILINNNDGAGCPLTAYSVLVEWSAATDMIVNSGFRKEY